MRMCVCVCVCVCVAGMNYVGISTYHFISYYASATHKLTLTRILEPLEDSEPTGLKVNIAACVRVYVPACMHACVCVCVHACMCVLARVRACVCSRVRARLLCVCARVGSKYHLAVIRHEVKPSLIDSRQCLCVCSPNPSNATVGTVAIRP